MRLMTRTHPDTLELTNLDGCWRTERAEAVEIEAMIPIPGEDVSRFCAEIYPRTTAASRC
jgi:hypothetical protein